MNNILSSFFGKKHANELEAILTDSYIPAKKAYMIARHGSNCTQFSLLKTFMDDLRMTIVAKSQNHEFMCMKYVDEDIIEVLPHVIDYMTNRMGYKCIVLGPDTVITNSIAGTDQEKGIRVPETILLVFWDTVDVSEHMTFEEAVAAEEVNDASVEGEITEE